MADSYEEIEGLKVRLDRLAYLPQLDAPAERPHPFAYFITIHNDSEESVILLRRKWILKDEVSGGLEVVEGEGIVGTSPRLASGESFTYNSYHICAASTLVCGAYFGRTDSGRRVVVKIPKFRLAPPDLP